MSKYDTSGDYKLLNWRCIAEVSEDGFAHPMLIGKYGMIYPVANDHYFVVFWSPQVARRWGVEITKGEEDGIMVDKAKAREIRKDLKTFRSMEAQLEKLQSL